MMLINNFKLFIHKQILNTSCIYSRKISTIDVTISEKTGIAVIKLKHLPVNVLNYTFLNDINYTIDELTANKSRGMVLTSGIPSVFCAGLDIKEFIQPEKDQFKEFWYTFQECWLKIYAAKFPTAAAINGNASVGGCVLAISTEYRTMINDPYTSIGFNETLFGIPLPFYVQNVLKSVISPREAELTFTMSKMYSAQRALEIGLIDEIGVDQTDAIYKCKKYIKQFDKLNRLARNITIHTFRNSITSEAEHRRKEDILNMYSWITQPEIQQNIQLHFETVKSKN